MKISVGQGLLLLIAYYDFGKIRDKTKVDSLKKLYLCGAENANDANQIRELLKDPILSEYQILNDPKTINDDPTRRYFETHLAYESLKNGLSKIDKNDLEKHVKSLIEMIHPKTLVNIEHVLTGQFKESDLNTEKEYTDYIAKIKSGSMFRLLSDIDREKIELLVKCTFLGMKVTSIYNSYLPLNIYGTGIYSDANRGKVMPKDQETTRNQHLGVMKGHMPLAQNDLAYSDKVLPYLKPSDQASFDERALFVKLNFDKLVHPFSNSISGTVLCQLRIHAHLKNFGTYTFTDSAEKLSQYTQLLISAMLFNSGGHTLNEFTAMLSLDAVRKEFKSIQGFENISLESMYLTKNEEGFNQALKDTVNYNNVILLKEKLHEQIRGMEIELSKPVCSI